MQKKKFNTKKTRKETKRKKRLKAVLRTKNKNDSFKSPKKKIMRDDSIRVTSTTVRIPVMGGHSESVNVEFDKEYDLEKVKSLLSHTPGVILLDDIKNLKYPMPMYTKGKDEVFVGRLRRDESNPKTLNMWIVADNLRKGAATNAVQIAEYICNNKLI